MFPPGIAGAEGVVCAVVVRAAAVCCTVVVESVADVSVSGVFTSKSVVELSGKDLAVIGTALTVFCPDVVVY